MVKPIPCRRFSNASMLDWITKLMEETHEVAREAALLAPRLAKGDWYTDDTLEVEWRLAEELTDVITLCTSWLDALGYDEEVRDMVQGVINQRNRKRGYFHTKKESLLEQRCFTRKDDNDVESEKD